MHVLLAGAAGLALAFASTWVVVATGAPDWSAIAIIAIMLVTGAVTGRRDRRPGLAMAGGAWLGGLAAYAIVPHGADEAPPMDAVVVTVVALTYLAIFFIPGAVGALAAHWWTHRRLAGQ